MLQYIEAGLVARVDSWAEGGDDLSQFFGVDALPFLPAMQPDLGLSDVQRLTVDLGGVGYDPDALQDVLDRLRMGMGRRVAVECSWLPRVAEQSLGFERIVEIGADQRLKIGRRAARRPA